jgi:5'-nucleotidase (lipoprotein e(P4) family)
MLVGALLVLQLAACERPASGEVDRGIEWVRDSAEYRALSLQAYRMAALALPAKLADPSWSALPDQHDAADLPPAIIFDVDETVLTNARFQVALVPPFRDNKLDHWSSENIASAVPGAVAFVQLAVQSGIEVFFVTNRPCEQRGALTCPQKQVVIDDLIEAGFPATTGNVSLSDERPEWSKEKSIRRDWIARDHRVIMLIGDDLGDFLPCTRKRPLVPCTDGATRVSRHALVERYADYWGNGWYVLPNPMHGSWTSFDDQIDDNDDGSRR